MTDVFRRQYRVLSETEKYMLDDMKANAEVLHQKIKAIGTSRETSLALTKLEESVMWATKAITG
jgi:hypothetical protein